MPYTRATFINVEMNLCVTFSLFNRRNKKESKGASHGHRAESQRLINNVVAFFHATLSASSVARGARVHRRLPDPEAAGPSRRASEDPIVAAMSLTGAPCPEFHVKVLDADGGHTRAPFSALVAGSPAVIHFYNAG